MIVFFTPLFKMPNLSVIPLMALSGTSMGNFLIRKVQFQVFYERVHPDGIPDIPQVDD